MNSKLFPQLCSLILIGSFLAGCKPESGNLDAAQQPGSSSRIETVTVIYNAIIHTVDEAAPLAAAMAFDSSGKILLLGPDQEVLDTYPDARHLDQHGLTVIPGLIDSHGHLNGLAMFMTGAQLTGTRSKQEIIQRLKAHEKILGEHDWLIGRGWDQNDWPEQEFPTRHDLDLAFPGRPVWLRRIDGHASWGNSVAIAQADRDLTGDWQEEGGFIHRDADGQPTGVFIDGAGAYVARAVPPVSAELISTSLDVALQYTASLGLTGVHDPGLDTKDIELYQAKIAEGRFPIRAYVMTDGAGATLDRLCGSGGLYDASGRLVVRSGKLYEDGALGSRGAALLEDYSDDPGNRGLMFNQPAALAAQVEKVLSCGFQVGIHAIGDAGNRTALDAIEAAMALYPDNPGRHRVEHAQVLSGPDLERFARLGVIAAVQPTHATSDMYWAEQRIGPRIRYAYAWRSLLDRGARLALGSDFPVEEVNPMLGIYAAVARKDLKGWPEGGWYPEEALSRQEALRGFTLDGAYAGFMEDQVGSLAAGKRADFAVLDRDIMRVPEEQIATAVVLETWLDGERIYSKLTEQ